VRHATTSCHGGAHEGPARDGVRAKVERLGLSHEEQQVLGRNLRALLQARHPEG
jgi:hypothetical protein